MLCGFGIACSGPSLAAEWQIDPRIDVIETYSNNISLNSKRDDYVTQIMPAITVKADGNRLQLDSNYSLQSIYYADNSSHNKTYNQLQLGADAELIDDLFYLEIEGKLAQQLLSPTKGVAADNLNIGSGRSDVVTSRVVPRIKRRLGNSVEFDLSYSEGRVNYDNAAVADGALQDSKFSMGRVREGARLGWQLNYDQSRQWAADTLTFEREQSSAGIRLVLFDHLSLVANGGSEDGYILSTREYKSGTYWSAGLMWRPSAHLSLQAASGESDRQASLMWVPGPRTSLNLSYLDREVGVRTSNAVTGAFRHATRRTLWVLSHVEELTSDTVLAIVEEIPVIKLDENGDPVFDEFDRVMVIQQALLGVVTEHYRRERNQGSFTYSSRKNDLGVGINSEQRHYEFTGREARLHGGFIAWRKKLSVRTSSEVKYSLNRSLDSINSVDEIETQSLSWLLRRSLGKHITTGIELRRTEVDGGTAALERSENRLSAYARVAF